MKEKIPQDPCQLKDRQEAPRNHIFFFIYLPFLCLYPFGLTENFQESLFLTYNRYAETIFNLNLFHLFLTDSLGKTGIFYPFFSEAAYRSQAYIKRNEVTKGKRLRKEMKLERRESNR